MLAYHPLFSYTLPFVNGGAKTTILYMHIPYCTCTYHTVHVHIILYVYIPYSTCTYHNVHINTILYMYIPYCTCTYHTVHAHTILYMNISYCTCTYHTVHVHTILYMHISYCTCTYHTVISDVTHNNDILMIITIPRGVIPWLPLTCYVLLYILFTFILPHPSQKLSLKLHMYIPQ